MAPSNSECSSLDDITNETNLQPFFVLHRASSSSSSSRPKARRRLNHEAVDDSSIDGDNDITHLRLTAFHHVWSIIHSTIKDVLKDINTSIFNDVNAWVHTSFQAITSSGKPGIAQATHPYPIALDALSKQIYTALVFTKNMEFVDDQLTFEELGNHLKSSGCHVANMSSLDFSAKNGIGGCLNSLFRKFLMVTLDDADMSVLASWYCGQREGMPVVIIVEDMERCCASVLSDFILMLSKWAIKIPVILIMGIATTLDAPRNLLSSNSLLCLRTTKFILGSPAQRMDSIVEAIVLRPCSWFNVGHKVALFMKDYFLKYDGTLTSFIRALKIACMLHFSSEPLSVLLKYFDSEDQLQEKWMEKRAHLQKLVLKCPSQLSCRRDNDGEQINENFIHAVRELKRLYKSWAMIVMCLYEAGKPLKVQLLDLYSEALDPDIDKSRTSYIEGKSSSRNGCFSSEHVGFLKKDSICKVVQKVRELSLAELSELLNSWERHAGDVFEIRDKIKELQIVVNSTDNKSSGSDLVNGSLRSCSRGTDSLKEFKALNEKAAALIEWMLRDQLKPIESLPFHELLCFKKVDKLQTALLGDPRKKVQVDLLESHKYLRCSCCSARGSRLLPSLHDTSILYILAQEHGDIINVHDWFQSFKTILVTPSTKAKTKSKRSSTPKKKDIEHSNNEAVIQARFCKAISELQVTGLLRMPTKRRPDFVQRVAFGV